MPCMLSTGLRVAFDDWEDSLVHHHLCFAGFCDRHHGNAQEALLRPYTVFILLYSHLWTVVRSNLA